MEVMDGLAGQGTHIGDDPVAIAKPSSRASRAMTA